MPAAFPGNSTTKLARSDGAGGFESAIDAITGGSGITGTIAEGSTLTVDWDGSSGFGENAPDVVLWDDSRGRSPGDRLSDAAPPVGSYDQAIAFMVADGHSKGVAWAGLYSDQLHYMSKIIFAPSNKLLVAYWTKNIGSLPGHQIGTFTLNDGGAVSNWKSAWLLGADGANTSEAPDLCVPTSANPDSFAVGGNDSGRGLFNSGTYENSSNILSYDEWWMTLGLVDLDNKTVKMRHVSPSKGWKSYDLVEPEGWGTTTPQTWDRINMPGYLRTGTDVRDGRQIHHDDWVVQTGPGAGCFALIGNASTLSTCTDFAFQRIISHSNSQLQIECLKGPFADFSNKYLFVLDENLDPVPYSGSEGRILS